MVPIPKIPADLRDIILDFYRAERRDLPWRHTSDPYEIWVSEIMLQQTQVKTVVPRYGVFLERFPTVSALAGAMESEVCEAWAGLGYYRRARNLHKGACAVVDDHDGVVPTNAKDLQEIPGIGRYTAGAIASIAFGEEAPLVDGNVVRLFSRLFALPGHSELPALKKVLWQVAAELVIGEAPGDLNQALMELGATVCTPVNPECGRCPLQRHCCALAEGTPENYPERAPKARRKRLAVAFAWHENRQGIWLEQRPLEGLWSGLWELPSGEGPTMGAARDALAKKLGQDLGDALLTVKHELTHRRVSATVYGVERPPGRSRRIGRRYRVPLEAPLSSLARKAIEGVS